MLITGQVLCDTNDLDLDDSKKQLAESVFEDVKKQLPELDLDKAKAEAPSLEDVEKTLKEKCDKNGGEGTYNNFEVSACRIHLWTFIYLLRVFNGLINKNVSMFRF